MALAKYFRLLKKYHNILKAEDTCSNNSSNMEYSCKPLNNTHKC